MILTRFHIIQLQLGKNRKIKVMLLPIEVFFRGGPGRVLWEDFLKNREKRVEMI